MQKDFVSYLNRATDGLSFVGESPGHLWFGENLESYESRIQSLTLVFTKETPVI